MKETKKKQLKNNKKDFANQTVKSIKNKKGSTKVKDNKRENKNIKSNNRKKNTRNFKLKKSVKISILLIFLIVLISLIFLIIPKFNEKKSPEPNNQETKIDYNEYFHEKVRLLKDKTLYQLKDNELVSVGTIYQGTNLELTTDEYQEQGYFRLKNFDYYIDYTDLEEISSLQLNSNTYLNYIPFNENVKTIDKTNFYLNNTLFYSLNEEVSLPIIIKEEDFYGVLYNNQLLYLKKDEVEVVENENTSLKSTDGIAVLTYHFVYDSTNPEEEKECKNSNVTICLSDELFRDHLTYIKENGFYTATMEDLELFIDGKINLPEKTVVLTIDDGYFVSAAIKVLEELDLHATLFLIGSAGDPSDYQSPNLEIHSHSYSLHYTGACPGGQGSPLKCLDKEKLLADLKKSREQLNGSTVFCYPFFEYNDYAIEVLKEAGFTMAFAGGRTKIRVGSNKYKLPRYGVINTTWVSDIEKIIN